MFCRTAMLKYFWWETSDRFFETQHSSGVKLCHECGQFHLIRWKIYSTLSCPALFYCQCNRKRKQHPEMKQDNELWFWIIQKLFLKISNGSSSWETVLTQCHLPCSLTVANKIRGVVPSRSSLSALFSSSSLLLPHDADSSCGRSPQLPPAPVAGAVLGLCWGGPTRTWHLCARQSDPPLNKREVFLPEVFTA